MPLYDPSNACNVYAGGRYGGVPVPTPIPQPVTLEEMRVLAESLRRELMGSRKHNQTLHEQLRRANQRRQKADAEQVLLEEAGDLVLALAAEHGQSGDCFGDGICEVCVLADKFEALKRQ